MATLQGTQINNTYPGLLKTTDNTVIGATLKKITDGDGNNTPLSMGSNYIQLSADTIELIEPTGGTNLMMIDPTQVTFEGTVNFTNATVIGIGGGGGPAITGYNSLRGYGLGSGTNQYDQWKTSYYGTSFSTASTNVSGTRVKCAAMALYEGGIINEFSIYVTSAVAATTLTAVIYKAGLNANGQIIATTLEANLGTIDVSTTGQKIITGINHTLGTTIDGIYFVGVHNASGDTVGINGIASSSVGGGVLSTSLYATTAYRGNTYTFSGQSSLPTDLSLIPSFQVTKDTDFPLFGVRS